MDFLRHDAQEVVLDAVYMCGGLVDVLCLGIWYAENRTITDVMQEMSTCGTLEAEATGREPT